MAEYIQKLKDLIKNYDYHYYVLGKPLVSDQEFDALFQELETLEKKNPHLITPDSPTQKVGNDLSNDFKEIPHSYPMLSLNKVYSVEELLQWCQKVSDPIFSLEPKIDGIAVSLTYEKGILKQALSRGNGLVGNDITHNIKTIKTLPLSLKSDHTYTIRGEVFLLKEDFEIIKNQGELEYANPRNFVAGVVRRIQSDKVKTVPLKVFIYEAICHEKPFLNHQEMLDFLIQNQFPVSSLSCFLTHSLATESLFDTINPSFNGLNLNLIYQTGALNFYSLEELSTIIDSFSQNRPRIPFEIDGLVFKINNYEMRTQMGSTSHHPRWAMAFKFESPKSISTVEDIIVQVGRTGKITPLAIVTPTLVNGSTISKATLHNQTYIDSLELGIGDIVEISKRGEIIPSIEKVIDKVSPKNHLIDPFCPSCRTPLEQKGAHLFCSNFYCHSKMKERLLYFTKVLDMDGFGTSLIHLLYESFKVQTFAALISFDYQRLLDIEGFKDKKVNHYAQTILKTLELTPFRKLLMAIGIPEINEKLTSILWNQGYTSLSKLKELSYALELETIDITQWHQIGQKGSISIKDAFKKDSLYLKELNELLLVGFKNEDPPLQQESFSSHPQTLSGTTWLITGTLPTLHPRAQAVEYISSYGGKVVSTFTKQVTHLLVGESAGSKLKKAQQAQIAIIDEPTLFKMTQN